MVMELVKTPKGNKYLYEVKDGNGQVLATRISSRSYVAATANGKFFFGRKSLVGRGEHAKGLRGLEECLSYGPKEWEKSRREYLRLYGDKIANKYYNPANMEEDIEEDTGMPVIIGTGTLKLHIWRSRYFAYSFSGRNNYR